jgi:glutamine synthetase adenylyltransferase
MSTHEVPQGVRFPPQDTEQVRLLQKGLSDPQTLPQPPQFDESVERLAQIPLHSSSPSAHTQTDAVQRLSAAQTFPQVPQLLESPAKLEQYCIPVAGSVQI